MGRQYSSKDFFRQMPNALLARYFNARGLMAELDFSAMPEGKPEALFEAWGALTDAQRSAAEADFRDIVALCDRKGWLAIVDEARWQLEDQPEALQAFSTGWPRWTTTTRGRWWPFWITPSAGRAPPAFTMPTR